MKGDKRKSARRAMRFTAWIAQPGKDLHGCVLADISDTGARLNVENPQDLPEEFVLYLSSRGSPRRKCKVAWRTKTQIGVQFDFPLTSASKTSSLMAMLAAKRAREVEQAMAERETASHETEPSEPA
jgi:hypothetical protein